MKKIDELIAEFDRDRLVKRYACLLGQDEIKETNLTESGDKVCCRFEIFEV